MLHILQRLIIPIKRNRPIKLFCTIKILCSKVKSKKTVTEMLPKNLSHSCVNRLENAWNLTFISRVLVFPTTGTLK